MCGADNHNILPLPTKDNKKTDHEAIQMLKDRFVRLPSKTAYAQFKDLETGTVQGDTYILEHFYKSACKKHGLISDQDKNGAYLLKCLPVVYGETFKPHQPAITSSGLVNLWKPPELKPSGNKVEADQVPLFDEFLDRWFPIKEEKEYFLWWVAMTVRRQDVKITPAPLLRSAQGCGKGFFVETLMSELLGKHSVGVCALKEVLGDFNGIIEGKTFLLIDEVYRSKTTTADRLKPIQANVTVTLNRKHQPEVPIDNYLNIIVTSNDMIPVLLEDDDRRFFIPQFIRHKESQSETDFFINKQLKPWLKYHGGFQLVRDYLETIDLSAYYATSPPPLTKAKKDLLGHSMESKLIDALKEIISKEEVVMLREIKSQIADDFDRTPADATVASALFSLGCEQKITRSKRVYITPFGKESGLSVETPPSELSIYCPSLNR